MTAITPFFSAHSQEIIPGFSSPILTLSWDHETVARLTLALSCNGTGPHGHLEDVWVSPSHRGHGFGLMLVRRTVTWARSHGLYKITLTCKPDLVSFYETNLFAQTQSHTMRFDIKTE